MSTARIPDPNDLTAIDCDRLIAGLALLRDQIARTNIDGNYTSYADKQQAIDTVEQTRRRVMYLRHRINKRANS